jgi:hypothetical protein
MVSRLQLRMNIIGADVYYQADNDTYSPWSELNDSAPIIVSDSYSPPLLTCIMVEVCSALGIRPAPAVPHQVEIRSLPPDVHCSGPPAGISFDAQALGMHLSMPPPYQGPIMRGSTHAQGQMCLSNEHVRTTRWLNVNELLDMGS